ncbi:MAG: putative glycosyl transferase [Candidatus Eremiobacteraeota bacterium]|nr:putative glycosyl transferase [Candidatus Eremiobacteraeota bacterium]
MGAPLVRSHLALFTRIEAPAFEGSALVRVAILSLFYPPEPAAGANRVAAMVRAFADAGHSVKVYTGMPSFPDGVIQPAYSGKRHAIERDGAIEIERVWTFASSPSFPANRLLNWSSVSLGIAIRIVAVREKYDAIVVSSPPITLAFPALLGAFAHLAPLVVDIRDVWPEMAIKVGSWNPNSPVAKIIGAIADTLYERAAFIACVTESACAEIVARRVDPAKIVLAPNGFDPLEPAASSPLATPPGVRDVVYAGNMGFASGLNVVLDAAGLLRDDPTIRFVLIGGGADAMKLRARVANEGLANVVFTGPLPRAEALRAVADAAATVVSLVPELVDTIPAKMFDAMVAGSPMVVSAGGEAQRLIERADAGIAVPPGDPQALAAGIRRILGDDSMRARFRANGPSFVRANYDRAATMRDFAARVASCCRARSETGKPAVERPQSERASDNAPLGRLA